MLDLFNVDNTHILYVFIFYCFRRNNFRYVNKNVYCKDKQFFHCLSITAKRNFIF